MYYFLDVDGVLNKESDWRIPFSINAGCLKCFANLLSFDKDPHIILSSTWRAGYTNTGVMSARGNSLADKLAEYGLMVEDSTPITDKTRQEEIEYYIRRHEIGNYIVLDDDESLFPFGDRINLYLTDYKTGLTEKDVKIIRKKYKLK